MMSASPPGTERRLPSQNLTQPSIVSGRKPESNLRKLGWKTRKTSNLQDIEINLVA